MIIKAMIYAKKMHRKQKRIGGEPFIIHPMSVMKYLEAKGYIGDILYVALFHDLLEDTKATEDDIKRHSNQVVLDAVKLLTKKEGYDQKSYLEGIKGNQLALKVKVADRIHNLKSAVCTTKSFKIKYINETKAYYVELAKMTEFEDDLLDALNELENSVGNDLLLKEGVAHLKRIN